MFSPFTRRNGSANTRGRYFRNENRAGENTVDGEFKQPETGNSSLPVPTATDQLILGVISLLSNEVRPGRGQNRHEGSKSLRIVELSQQTSMDCSVEFRAYKVLTLRCVSQLMNLRTHIGGCDIPFPKERIVKNREPLKYCAPPLEFFLRP